MIDIDLETHGGLSLRIGRLVFLYAQRELWVCWIGRGPICRLRVGAP